MKIRNGFVSNSSSSSFIMLIPKNFNVDEFDLTLHQKELYNEETFRNNVKKLISEGYLYGDVYNQAYSTITSILSDFVITSVDTGPDEGIISLLDDNDIIKIKKILKVKV